MAALTKETMMRNNPNPIRNHGRTDMRYRIGLEFCGYETARFVVRFCDEFISSHATYGAALVRATGHNQVRNGALVIEGIPA